MASGLRLLSVPIPESNPQAYRVAKLTSKDYPQLIESGEDVETIAINIVLITRNWPARSPRRRKIERFTNQLRNSTDRIGDLEGHLKWKDVKLNAPISGMQRFESLERKPAPNRSARPAGNSQLPSADDLFKEFKTWSRGQTQ